MLPQPRSRSRLVALRTPHFTDPEADLARPDASQISRPLPAPIGQVPRRSALLLCTMHNATKHCGLRKRGNKSLKAPRNEELYMHLFKRKPTGRLHRALPDCCVTLACYVKGSELKWW